MPVLLDEAQTVLMFENDYTWYGLNNTYTGKLFAQISNTEQTAWTGNQTAFVSGMADQY
jgi:hypothetical protein